MPCHSFPRRVLNSAATCSPVALSHDKTVDIQRARIHWFELWICYDGRLQGGSVGMCDYDRHQKDSVQRTILDFVWEIDHTVGFLAIQIQTDSSVLHIHREL